MAQKPEIVEAALVQHRLRRTRLRPGGPINLVLDLRDKLLDLGGRGERRGPLQADQGRLVFLIGKIALQETAGQQRPADQDHEEEQVFAEEVPLGLTPGLHGAHTSHQLVDDRVCSYTACSGTNSSGAMTVRPKLSNTAFTVVTAT